MTFFYYSIVGAFISVFLFIVFTLPRPLLDLLTTTYVKFYSPSKKGSIALTIDDSPDPLTTPGILDALKKANIKVTFFIIGSKAEKCPELMKRIVKEGHQLANHDYYDHRSAMQVPGFLRNPDSIPFIYGLKRT
jgi:peptidoglycan/xylan/chitin deacetylase (PgdA/CDA1 family)